MTSRWMVCAFALLLSCSSGSDPEPEIRGDGGSGGTAGSGGSGGTAGTGGSAGDGGSGGTAATGGGPIWVAGVEVTPSVTTLASPGDSARFTATAKDPKGLVIRGKDFTWESSNTSVATVDDAGLATAVSEGLVTITATADGVTGSAELAVGFAFKLAWPIDCIPGVSCLNRIGYPDIDGDGQAFNCRSPGYWNHQGTDINITSEQMGQGVEIFAAAAGQVLWVFDGKYDRCPDPSEPDCQPDGYTVCTPGGDFCGTGICCCSWCFAGGNVVVIRHIGVPGVFATRYDHFKTNSIVVEAGQMVQRGEKIGEAGSAGASSRPHLHFEVWGTGFYELADPWAGPCGPNTDKPLWAFDPPWGG